jgi:catechol 2,3-dioxygenase-like lactoylglutathione lyase family enzyme
VTTNVQTKENAVGTDLGFDGGLTCAYGVSDLERSIAWYCDVLGFEVTYKLDDMAWCELKSPVDRVQVGLSQVEELKVEGGCTMTYGVKDIDRARAALEKQSVRFDGDTVTIPEMVKLATFYDPDGNKLMLYQDLQKA